MAEFVGESRQAALQTLLDRLEAIKSGDTSLPRIILLEGPSGYGKSRIIRELYSELRQRTIGDYPQYWPALNDPEISSTSRGANPLTDRKVLGPPVADFEWAAQSLPSFLWLTTAFSPDTHLQFETVRSQLLEALRWHNAPLLMAHTEIDGLDDRVRQQLARKLRSIRSSSPDEWASQTMGVLEEVLGLLDIGLPGMGYAMQGVKRAIHIHIDRAKRKKDFEHGTALGPNERSRLADASELALQIHLLLRKEIPGILAIEDAHWCAPDLPYLLNSLAASTSDLPFLVVATAWPEGRVSGTSAYTEWLEAERDNGRLEILPLPPLEPTALRVIIDSHVGATDEATKSQLVERWNNPYSLELFLTAPETVFYIEEEAGQRRLDIALDELTALPDTIEGLYAQRWRTVPNNVKRALIAAAGMLPSSRPMQPFEIDVVSEVLQSSETLQKWARAGSGGDHFTSLQVEESLTRAREIAWTITEGAGDAFREPDIAQVVLQNLGRQPREVLAELRLQVTQSLEDRILAMASPGLILNPEDGDHALAAIWLLRLGSHKTEPRVAAAYLNARLAAQDGLFPDALSETESLLDLELSDSLQAAQESWLRIRADIISWIGESGESERARILGGSLASESREALGANHEVALLCRAVEAHWTGICEMKSQALETYEEIDQVTWESHHSSAHMRTVARSGHALWQGEVGDWPGASRMFGEVVDACAPVLGARHPLILQSRRGQARAEGEAGNLDRAVGLYEALVVDCATWFGPKSPQNFESRRGLARWQLANGDNASALEGFASVYEDCLAALGPSDFLTLWAQQGLFEAQVKSGQVAEATATQQDLQANTAHLDASHRLHTRVRENALLLPD